MTVSGWARSADGHSLQRGDLVFDATWVEFGKNDLQAKGVFRSLPIDDAGSFSFDIEDMRRKQSTAILHLSFDVPDSPWPFEDDRPQTEWYVKWPIPDQLNWGAVRLSVPSAFRPYAELSDEGLESHLRASWEGKLGAVSQDYDGVEWNRLLLEATCRKGERWESLLQRFLDQFLERDEWNEFDAKYRGELEVLTALRRIQGRPDPILLDVMPGSDLVVLAPAMPGIAVKITNRDEVPVSLDAADYLDWRVEARSTEGRILERVRSEGFGRSYVSSRRKLSPGETVLEKVAVSDQLAPFVGRAELHVTFNDRVAIATGFWLTGLILFHANVVQMEALAPTTNATGPKQNLWPMTIDDERIRALAREASIPLLEREGVLLVATDDCSRFVDVLEKHDILLLRGEAWWREEVGARREAGQDVEFVGPDAGSDAHDGARSILAARFWIQGGGGFGARFVFHLREHAGS